jgi:hypothetical protein
LLFEDAAEETQTADDAFAWTGEDYLGWFVGGGRFLTNTVLCPISAVVTPPWSTMVSDGLPEQRVLGTEVHDSAMHNGAAKPGDAPARPSGASG